MRNGRACWVTLTGKRSPAATCASLLAWNPTSLTIISGDVPATTCTSHAVLSAIQAAGTAVGWRRPTRRANASASIDPAHKSAPRRGAYGECASPDGQRAAAAKATVTLAAVA